MTGAGAACADRRSMRRFPRRWWVPGRCRGRGVRRGSSTPARSSSTRSSTTSRAAGGQTRDDVLELASRGRSGGRRRLRSRRQPPHDGGQRLCHRAGPHEARGPLRHAAGELRARRVAAGGRARARPRALPRRPATGCCSWRSSLRSACSRCATDAHAAWRPGAAGPATVPRARRGAGARSWPRRHDAVQPALAPHRGAGRLASACADRPARRLHRLREADHAAQRLRPGPAGWRSRCSRPTRPPSSGSGSRRPTARDPASGSSSSAEGPPYSGRFLMPSRVCHLE